MVQIKLIPKDDWLGNFSESAHLAVFGEHRQAKEERIDYALLAIDSTDSPLGYVTVRELDSETAFWLFGGAVAPKRGSFAIHTAYKSFIGRMKEMGYKSILTLIENKNTRYLRFAMEHGFRIIGTRAIGGDVSVEMGMDLTSVQEQKKEGA